MSEFLFKLNYRPETCNFFKKETLTLVLSCEFYEIFRKISARLLLYATQFGQPDIGRIVALAPVAFLYYFFNNSLFRYILLTQNKKI